jgi:hypothetical protein
MFNIKVRDTYDKTDPKVLKQMLDAAFSLGNSGTEVNQAATNNMNTSKADVAAIIRVQQMFSHLPLSDKLHKNLNARLSQENKWLNHHTRLVEATKRGYEKMKVAAKAAGLIDEAFAAGEAEAEKKLKLKAGNMQARVDDKDNTKKIDPKFQQQDKNNQQQNNNQQNNNQNKPTPVTLVVDKLVIAKGKKAKKYASQNGFMQAKKMN